MGEHAATLSAAQAEFIQGPRSIFVASRDAARRPSLARAIGARVTDDRRGILLLLHRDQAAPVLRDVEPRGELAVVFTSPPTHQTLQLKGRATRVALPADAGARVRAQVDAFTEMIAALGFGAPLIDAMFRAAPDALAALAFAPAAVFEQTPGPQAGQRIGERP
ncbi:pyridoxamine 5'-phosphate oxidase family protein [Solimonas soli]|uniref:pyridoxamine 5'-phosphate oxidase family protein n=1 Tax=Solimonas soli TaxID=413479 RepID=UPI0004B21403|nr:pyridoxamine 5'-phosphate oxidase family protein [Solimonas soli]